MIVTTALSLRGSREVDSPLARAPPLTAIECADNTASDHVATCENNRPSKPPRVVSLSKGEEKEMENRPTQEHAPLVAWRRESAAGANPPSSSSSPASLDGPMTPTGTKRPRIISLAGIGVNSDESDLQASLRDSIRRKLTPSTTLRRHCQRRSCPHPDCQAFIAEYRENDSDDEDESMVTR